MDFYKQLNYSLGNEDWDVEKQALKVRAGDTILCVTASGDRSLRLLMTDCAKIISVDMNPVQNYLLELKMAAINQLDYDAYIAFLGGTASKHRLAIFNQLKLSLSSEAAAFWSQHQKMIVNGIIYQGKIERLSHVCALFLNCIWHKKIKTLLAFTDINEQRTFVSAEWNTFFWRKLFEILSNPALSKYIVEDPGLNVYTDYTNKPGEYINQRLLSYLENHLARKSPLLQLILTGKILPEAYFPYLTEEGHKKIGRNMKRLSYQTTNIIDYLKENKSLHFDVFSLSDIASYMPQAVFEKLLSAIGQRATTGARFCVREFMSKRCIPKTLSPLFIRDYQLEKKLENEEKNFVYRFMAGRIDRWW
jgi:S-adenosylmethionine-diacylglycerol 3-amino-3-carboxypropyl transferase